MVVRRDEGVSSIERGPKNPPHSDARSRDDRGLVSGGIRWLARRCPIDLGGGSDATVFLAGSGRSGTTWLGEFLVESCSLRYVFEPFHPRRSPLAALFPARTYLAAGAGSEEQHAAARRLMSGHIRDRWIDGHNRRPMSRGRLVKDVWSNLRLGWIRALFPTTPIVLLLRHPCATVASQLGSGWDWLTDPQVLLGQSSLMDRHLSDRELLIGGASEPLERAAVAWCVDTLVPLRELRPGQAHVILYEDLLIRPEEQLEGLFDYLGRTPPAATATETLARPSAMSLTGRSGGTPEERIGSWTRSLSADDAARIMAVVERFGLDHLYAADPLPRHGAAEAAFEIA